MHIPTSVFGGVNVSSQFIALFATCAFEFGELEFGYCLGFRVWDLEFLFLSRASALSSIGADASIYPKQTAI
jgi:hypothetical protein